MISSDKYLKADIFVGRHEKMLNLENSGGEKGGKHISQFLYFIPEFEQAGGMTATVEYNRIFVPQN